MNKNIILDNKETLRGIFAVSMIIAGITHYLAPYQYIKIVPSVLPYPDALVYISGFFEIVGGIALLIPALSQAAAWGFVLLLIAVYPANINMAVNHIHVDHIPDSNLLQAIRLPFQFVLIAWAWWFTKEPKKINNI